MEPERIQLERMDDRIILSTLYGRKMEIERAIHRHESEIIKRKKLHGVYMFEPVSEELIRIPGGKV